MPTLPTRFCLNSVALEVWLIVLLAIAAVGISILIGWILTKVMKGKGFKTSMPTNLILSGVTALVLTVRYGFTMTMVQGVLLLFVLLYASCSDLTDHTMDDFLWVMVVILGLLSTGTVGIVSMLVGAAMIFVPQMLTALLAKNPIGGADIKLTTALAFLLGWQRGLVMLIAGMLIAVVAMLIIKKVKNTEKSQPFALIPYISVAAMVVFFI